MKQIFKITLGTFATIASCAVISVMYADVIARQPVKTTSHKSRDIVRGLSSSFDDKTIYSGKTLVRSSDNENLKYETIIDEDFSLMTAGMIDSPDDTHLIDLANDNIYIPDQYTHQPGWSGTGVF